jgi:hypothetical protein
MRPPTTAGNPATPTSHHGRIRVVIDAVEDASGGPFDERANADRTASSVVDRRFTTPVAIYPSTR